MTAVSKRLNVSQRDIEMGQRFHPALCPVGRALNRAFGEWQAALVCSWSVLVPGFTGIDTPPRIREWIERFDDGETMQPARFRITLVRDPC